MLSTPFSLRLVIIVIVASASAASAISSFAQSRVESRKAETTAIVEKPSGMAIFSVRGPEKRSSSDGEVGVDGRLPSPQLDRVKRPQQSQSGGWSFAFSPYIFLSSFRGTVGARGRTVEIDSSSGDVTDNLDFGLMGTFEARKNKFIILADFMWIRLSAERNTRGGVFGNAKVGANMAIIDPEAGYRLAESKTGSLDILGGVRIWSVENTLTVTAGTQPGFGAAQRKTFAAPVVGVRGILNLSPRFFLTSKVDVGAGSGTHSTSQFYGGAGFKIKQWVALGGGYRYLQVDHDDESGFIFDTRMSGPVIGAKFIF